MKETRYSKLCELVVVGIVLTSLLAACQPTPVADWESAIASPVSLGTPTQIVYRTTRTPPIATRTQPVATALPASPGGELISEDGFENGGMWDNKSAASGNVIASGEKITLAVKTSKGMLVQMRREWLPNDYYLEVMVEARLCRSEDVFGILFRAPSELSNYRLLFTCGGKISLQQMVGGTPTPLVDWTQSGALEPGLPFPVKTGILVSGRTIRVSLNDIPQFELERDLFREGGVGFYARAAGDTPVTVNFFGLKYYQPLVITPTPTETIQPGTPSATP